MNAPVKSAAIEILRSEKGSLAADIQFELVASKYKGVTATAKLELKTIVNDGRPVHDTGTLGMKTFKVLLSSKAMAAMKAMKAGARAMTGGVLTKKIAESTQLKTKDVKGVLAALRTIACAAPTKMPKISCDLA